MNLFSGKYYELDGLYFRVHQVINQGWVRVAFIYPDKFHSEFGWKNVEVAKMQNAKEITEEVFMKHYVSLLVNYDEISKWI